ncbi:MAG: SUMF1/EgtB/PvdO family nonheme iron enzyme [Anaerolineales bacterium]|jgi:formylglycine-generating enzyme required for sulfatase activity
MSTQNAKKLAILLLALFLASCARATPQPPAAIVTPSSPPATSTVTQSPPPSPTTMPTPTLAPGQTRTDPSGIQQVWVPAGSFQMGSGDATIQELQALSPPAWVRREFASEQPQHEVRLTKGYWIDKYEVTNKAFQAFVDAGGYTRQDYWSDAGWQWLSRQNVDSLPKSCQGDAADLPRLCVTWYEAEAYAHWRGGRLPTEAEWEFAARGPQSLRYPWGNEFDGGLCNVVDSDGPVAVGSYPHGASWVGALDMAGNAMEWVQDWLGVNYYEQGISVDPTGPASGSIKVEKGGWWGSNLFVARAAYRHYEDPPVYGDKHIGFRIVSP